MLDKSDVMCKCYNGRTPHYQSSQSLQGKATLKEGRWSGLRRPVRLKTGVGGSYRDTGYTARRSLSTYSILIWTVLFEVVRSPQIELKSEVVSKLELLPQIGGW